MVGTMTYLIGSSFYNLNTPTSDKDYIQFIFPTREDLFKGNFTSKQTKNENGDDVVVKDIRLLLKGLKKGSLQMFEVLYSEPLNKVSSFDGFYVVYNYLRTRRNDLFEEQKGELLKAIQGELINRYKKFQSENTVKGYVNCCKLIWLFYTIGGGQNPFELIMNKDGYTEYWFEYYKNLRINHSSFKDIDDYVDRKEGLTNYYNDIKSCIVETNKNKPTLGYIEGQIFSEVFRGIC